MDFLLCALVSKTNIKQSIWYNRFTKFQYMEEIVGIIFNGIFTQELLMEEDIISFLYNSNFIPNPKFGKKNS